MKKILAVTKKSPDGEDYILAKARLEFDPGIEVTIIAPMDGSGLADARIISAYDNSRGESWKAE